MSDLRSPLADIVAAYRNKLDQRRNAAAPTPEAIAGPAETQQPQPEPQRSSVLPDHIQTLLDMGIDVIPIVANTKQALYPKWQERNPLEQIHQALDEQQAFNLAVRCGGQIGLIVIDCEDPETTKTIVGWLDYHNIQHYPIVRSASGIGNHLWLKCYDIPPAFTTFASLTTGHGEVRAGSGAYAMIPPSRAWSSHGQRFGDYSFETPAEQIDEMNPVSWEEIIAPLMAPTAPQTVDPNPDIPPPEEIVLPIPLPYQPAPPLVSKLLAVLQIAPEGQPIPHPNGTRAPYSSRSEAEQAIISTLILCGWPYPEIARLFEEEQPGHYRDIARAANKTSYLENSHRNALINIVSETPERQPILAAYHWAASPDWPLRSGLPRLVYQHILMTAYKDARPDPVVPYDSLQASTGAPRSSLFGALERLEQAGLIQRLPGDLDKREHNRVLVLLDDEKANYSHRGGCYTKSAAFSIASLLGRDYVAGYVYEALSNQVQSIAQLSALVMSNRGTVARCLAELEKLGLARQVHRYGWVIGAADVDNTLNSLPKTPENHSPALAVGMGILEELRQVSNIIGLATRLLAPESLSDDPVTAYVDIMTKVYGCKLKTEHLKEKQQQQLYRLARELTALHESGRLADPSSRHYIWWIARRYRQTVFEHSWPMVWINIVTSPKTIARYVKEHPKPRMPDYVNRQKQPLQSFAG